MAKLIAPFHDVVIACPIGIAPERKDDFFALFGGAPCDVHFTNTKANFEAHVNEPSVEIRFSALVSLWATAKGRLLRWLFCAHIVGPQSHSAGVDTAASAGRTRASTVNPIKAERLRHADTTSTIWPIGSISSPNASGASAWQIRDGAPISPNL